MEKQYANPNDMQKAIMAMRLLVHCNNPVRDYVQRFRNLQLRLVGVEDELIDTFILSLYPEIK